MLSGIRRSIQGVDPIVSQHEKLVPLSVSQAMSFGLRQSALPRPTERFGAESLDGDMYRGSKLKAFMVVEGVGQLIRAEFDLRLEDLVEPTASKPTGRAIVKGKSLLYGLATLDISMEPAPNKTRSGGQFETTRVTSSLSVEPSRAALLAVAPNEIHASLSENHPAFAEEYCRRIITMHQTELAAS